MSDYRTAYLELHHVLTEAQKERDKRRVNAGWIDYERNVMHDAVNRLLARVGREPATEQEIRSAESMACGHVDYTKKFALYCAEIVYPMNGAA